MPVHRILPPYLLEHIAHAGDEAQRARALATLGIDNTVRTVRVVTPRPAHAAPYHGNPLVQAGSPQARRVVFDCANAEDLRQATVARGEGQDPTDDPAVDEAYDGLGATYDFYWQAFQRDSIDGRGLPLNGYVHYGEDYDNAFWDGSEMVFGDGDGELFNRFTIAVDVIGHELTHGVTSSERDLRYSGQSGALNEHVSDVFGSLVKQFAGGQTAGDADWLIGVGLLAPGVQGRALRDMLNPGTAYDDPVLGTDPQPAHMRDYVSTTSDNGGVHINSGIPNRAFALFAMALGGNAWEAAGTVWYRTIRDAQLPSDATFQEFADVTAGNAAGAEVADALRDAWSQVGITVTT